MFTATITGTYHGLRNNYIARVRELDAELGGRRDAEAARRRDEVYVSGALARKYDPEIVRMRRAVRRAAAGRIGVIP